MYHVFIHFCSYHQHQKQRFEQVLELDHRYIQIPPGDCMSWFILYYKVTIFTLTIKIYVIILFVLLTLILNFKGVIKAI